jgi:hypothetical protein
MNRPDYAIAGARPRREFWCDRRLVLAILASALFPSSAARAHPQRGQPTEYQLKAAFLFNFAKFIDWPDKSFATSQSPFSVCVIGQDPFGQSLEESLAGKIVANHPVTVERFPNSRNAIDAQHCQIAFISSSEKPRVRDVIETFKGDSVLLVGDMEGFASSGGAIEFFVQDDRIHFAINPEAADRAELKVSSKLLALAKIVHDDPAKGRS